MVSTSYPSDATDWRGIFIRHLAFSLADRKDLKLSLWAPGGPLPTEATYVASSVESHWLAQLMRLGGMAHQFRSGGIQGKLIPFQLLRHLRSAYKREVADLYHVNWLQNVLPLPRNGRPVLVAVLGTDMQMLKVPGMTSLIRNALQGRSAAICPNADWMVPELERRFGDSALIRTVPFGMEPRWFDLHRAPQNRQQRWLCVTRLTKGKLGNLFDWCCPLFQTGQRELHLFGPMQESIEIPSWVHYHGPTTPEALSNEWFPMATGLITLSEHSEGRPQIMLEAMASGLPIIASNLPAHTDLIGDDVNGRICRSRKDLVQALIDLERSEINLSIGRTARHWVRREIGTWGDCAMRYVSIYQTLLKGFSR